MSGNLLCHDVQNYGPILSLSFLSHLVIMGHGYAVGANDLKQNAYYQNIYILVYSFLKNSNRRIVREYDLSSS